MVLLPRNKKHTCRLNSKPQMWPSDLALAMTLTLNFQGQIWISLYLSQKWSYCHETKSKHVDWNLSLKCDHRIWPWPWPWPWIFKVKYRIRFISARNGPIATKQKANISIELYASNVTIKFYLGHDLDYEFKGQIWNLPYLTQRWFDCNKMKSTHVEWTKGRNDHQVWPWPWPWRVTYKDLPDSDWGDFRCQCAVDSFSYHQLNP